MSIMKRLSKKAPFALVAACFFGLSLSVQAGTTEPSKAIDRCEGKGYCGSYCVD